MLWLFAMMIAGVVLGLTNNEQKARAWLGLMSAWAFGVLALMVWGFFPPPVPAFMAIDASAAWFVLRRPRALGQQLIGALFAVMLAWHLGFWLTDMGSVNLYLQVQLWLGWIQWGVLMAWGSFDAGKAFGLWPWHGRAVAVGRNDNGAGGQ